MLLHNDVFNFKKEITNAATFVNQKPSFVEKDYYVTMILKKVSEKFPSLLFKGGTSLSKCFKIINRFSEDLDLTIIPEAETNNNRRVLKRTIVSVCDELECNITNLDYIQSKRVYNQFKIKYPITFDQEFLNPLVIVETVYMCKAFPYLRKEATSLLTDYWIKNSMFDKIKKYELEPFTLNVQSLERTFVDKVFAICDYLLSSKVERKSRHLYDLYMLSKYVNLDENLKSLAIEINKVRKPLRLCLSSKDGQSIPILLKRIVDEKTYYNDYKMVSTNFIYDNITYQQAITAIKKIIDSKVFEF